MNRINVGDTYILMGAYQYGTTRNNVKILIEPYQTITKIRENFFDHLSFRNMWKINGTDCLVHIDETIIDRYFEKIP